MIKKSSIIVFIIFLLLGVLITNCSEDDDEETLIGTWMLTKMRTVYPVNEELDPAEYGYSETLTVRDDNSFTRVITAYEETTTINGTWATSGGKIIYTIEGETEEIEYSLKGDKLEISDEITLYGSSVPLILIYTRQ